MAYIFERASENTGGHSDIASVVPQWFTLPHQINATLPNILADDIAYVASRAVQFFLPGEPQVYYVGLFNGMDDQQLFERSGQGRDVNRHHYTPAEIEQALAQPVTQAIIGLARIRRLSVFEGEFSWTVTGPTSIKLAWQKGSDSASLKIDTKQGGSGFLIEIHEGGNVRRAATIEELAAI
jgi:sucrose phosphorylase